MVVMSHLLEPATTNVPSQVGDEVVSVFPPCFLRVISYSRPLYVNFTCDHLRCLENMNSRLPPLAHSSCVILNRPITRATILPSVTP